MEIKRNDMADIFRYWYNQTVEMWFHQRKTVDFVAFLTVFGRIPGFTHFGSALRLRFE